RKRCTALWKSTSARLGAGEASDSVGTRTVGRESPDRSHVHRQPALRPVLREPVQHAPADRGAHRTPTPDAARLPALRRDLAEDNGRSKGFKARAGRRFTETGEARDDAASVEEPSPQAAETKPAAAVRPPTHGREPIEITLSTFVMSLSTQALMCLG